MPWSLTSTKTPMSSSLTLLHSDKEGCNTLVSYRNCTMVEAVDKFMDGAMEGLFTEEGTEKLRTHYLTLAAKLSLNESRVRLKETPHGLLGMFYCEDAPIPKKGRVASVQINLENRSLPLVSSVTAEELASIVQAIQECWVDWAPPRFRGENELPPRLEVTL